MLGLIFCHGWGFSHEFWNNLKESFRDYPCIFWDLGYYGKRSCTLPKSGEWIGVGHSLGFVKLLQSGFSFKKIIAIQGFVNFLGFNQKINHARKKKLEKMINDFESNPLQVLENFFTLCGTKQNYKEFDKLRLKNDLLDLKSSFEHLLLNKSCLVLASKEDPIVPLPLLKDNFFDYPIAFNDHGKHALGFLESEWCAGQIKKVINE